VHVVEARVLLCPLTSVPVDEPETSFLGNEVFDGSHHGATRSLDLGRRCTESKKAWVNTMCVEDRYGVKTSK